MKKLLFYFIVLLAAVWAGLKIASDPGYVLIAYQKVTLEMPLWFAVISLSGLFFIVYFLFRLISNLRSLGGRIRTWSRTKRLRSAWQRTHRGLIALAAGEWKPAEKDLVRAASDTDTPLLNYLGSAYCAQAQGDISLRDAYLSKINAKSKPHKLALGLTQARLQLHQRQYEQALAILQQLQQIAPQHQPTLLLLKKIYLRLKDWGSLEALLPQLEKSRALKTPALEKLTLKAYEGLLKASPESADIIWRRLPKSLRASPALLESYIVPLSEKHPDQAEELLRAALQKNLDSRLLMHYGVIKNPNSEKQLQTAESFLKQAPDNAALLLTLGRLCVKNELWGKARSYFEASLSICACLETYQALAQLFEQLGETQKALDCYRKGLSLMINHKI